jgi:hypothetical protein
MTERCSSAMYEAPGQELAAGGGHPQGKPARHGPLGSPMKSAARSARVGTMIWTSRAALGAGGRNGTDRVIHKRDEEPH